MQYVRELDGLNTTALCAYLEKCSQPFETSMLYDSANAKKIVDETERSSRFRAIKDPALFEIAERLVEHVTATDAQRHFSLVRNDVTHILYSVGDFFNKHQDYLAVTSNVIEEYTLIICVTPETKLAPGHGAARRTRATAGHGGETIVYTHGEVLMSAATTTPGCGLLFRKDLAHEATRLEAGEKHIVTLNLWATRAAAQTERVLLVHFPVPRPLKLRRTCADARAHVRSVAREMSYAVAESKVAQYEGSFLAGLMQFAPAEQKIVRHECTACSYEQFGVVFKVLSNAYVSQAELADAAVAVDFYGLPTRNLLVDLAKAGDSDASRQPAGAEMRAFLRKPWHTLDEATILHELRTRVPRYQGMARAAFEERMRSFDVDDEGEADYLRSHLDAGMLDSLAGEGWREQPAAARTIGWLQRTYPDQVDHAWWSDGDGDVIVCCSVERTMVVSAEARAYALPYLPFRICFVEGTLEFDGDAAAARVDEFGAMWPGRDANWSDGFMQAPPEALQMLPVWISLGDYDNILYVRNLMHLEAGRSDQWRTTDDISLAWPQFETPRRRAVLREPNARVLLYEGRMAGDTFPGADGSEEQLEAAEKEVFGDDDDAPPILYNAEETHLHAALKLALPRDNGDLSRHILDMVFAHRNSSASGLDRVYEVLPRGEAPDPADTTCSQYFHIDAACFTADEALRACERVVEMDLVARVKAALGKTDFVLPQVQVNESTFFCNESVYGKATILMVTGVASLEENEGA